MKQTFDIVIAGAGVVGLTVAALLARGAHGSRFNIRVLDPGERPQFDEAQDVDVRVSAVSAGSVRLLASVGAWERVLEARAGPFREMRVWDANGRADGPEALHFDAAEFALPALGYIVENTLLKHSLLAVLDETDVALDFGAAIRDLESREMGVELECDDGRRLAADLVIGADGVSSRVRRHAQIAVRAWRYPQTAFVTHLAPEHSHRETAWQRFLPEGPLALLPLADGRVSIVWSTTPERAEEAAAATDRQLSTLVTLASDQVLGVLEPAGPRATFPLKAQHAVQYVVPGIALAGDAAHNIHPLAGQGANLGIADAAVLAETLGAAAAAGEHPGDLPVLRRYERARKGANQSMLYFVDVLNTLFLSRAPAIGALRGTGMRLFNHSGPLRKTAARVALGLQ
jgi:2-polyprenylphenol 6-hydroxylase